MEKKLYHRGAILTLYDELDNGAGVYCSRQGEDGAALILFCTEDHLADAYIPGVWWISHEGCSDEQLTTYSDYLRRHNRELCHFALDLFFDTSVDVDLKLPPDVALQIIGSAADYGESPQRYFLRAFRGFIKDLREQKSKVRAVVRPQGTDTDGTK